MAIFVYLYLFWNVWLKQPFCFTTVLDVKQSCTDSTESSVLSITQFALLLTSYMTGTHPGLLYFLLISQFLPRRPFPTTLQFVVSPPPVRDSFSDCPHFWWPWLFRGVPVRHFVGRPSVGVLLMPFSSLDWDSRRGPQGWRAHLVMSHQGQVLTHNSPLLTLTLTTWLRRHSPGSSATDTLPPQPPPQMALWNKSQKAAHTPGVEGQTPPPWWV